MMALKTPLEHCPCTCHEDYSIRHRTDPQCFSCNGGAELVEAVRDEFAREAAAKLLDAALPLHRSRSTFDGSEAAGLDNARRIVEALARPAPEDDGGLLHDPVTFVDPPVGRAARSNRTGDTVTSPAPGAETLAQQPARLDLAKDDPPAVIKLSREAAEQVAASFLLACMHEQTGVDQNSSWCKLCGVNL